jgi:hypothetical protein
MNSFRKVAAGGAIVAAAITGGALGANLFGTANAQTSTTTPPSSATAPPQGSFPAHGSADHEGAEKAVTGDAASKAQAAAVKSVGGGTAGAVTSDYRGGGYEVTVTKPDGSQTEVHLDSSFNVMQHGPHGGNDGDAGDQAPSSTTTN